jgi:hypothetical protein
MKKTSAFLLCTLGMIGCGGPVEDSLEAEPLAAESNAIEVGCSRADERRYETTSYTTQEQYLWQCQGQATAGGPTIHCNTYKVCQVENVYVHSTVCSGGILSYYTTLKSSTVTANCYNRAVNVATGGACAPVLYGAVCY